jgi:hypothetical protein
MFKVPFVPLIIYIRPTFSITAHRDGLEGSRVSAIFTPLYPSTNYKRTEFWESLDSPEPSFSMGLEDLPAIVNLQELHSVQASEVPRFSFQLSFDLPYDELCEMYFNGDLVKGSSPSPKPSGSL